MTEQIITNEGIKSIKSEDITKLRSPFTGEFYKICANCGHIKQSHFSGGREHGCSNSQNFPKMCNCQKWVEQQ